MSMLLIILSKVVELPHMGYLSGDYFYQNRMWVCLLDLKSCTFSLPSFHPITHPSVSHFDRKASSFSKFGSSDSNLLRIHPIYVIWAPLSLMKPTDIKFCEKAPQKGKHIWSRVVWWDTKIVGDITLFSHLSDITCCHKAILSPIESSLGLFNSLIILLSKNVLQIKMRICLISENY